MYNKNMHGSIQTSATSKISTCSEWIQWSTPQSLLETVNLWRNYTFLYRPSRTRALSKNFQKRGRTRSLQTQSVKLVELESLLNFDSVQGRRSILAHLSLSPSIKRASTSTVTQGDDIKREKTDQSNSMNFYFQSSSKTNVSTSVCELDPCFTDNVSL